MDSIVLDVKKETPDTVTLRLSAPFSIIPGQFIMIGVHIDGKELKRSYSVSGFGEGFVEITIKEQHPGIMSSFAQHVKPGTALQLYGPFGKFSFNHESNHELVLIAAGSGIAPFRSYLQTGKQATLIYSVRTGNDIIFAEQLKTFEEQGTLRSFITLTRPNPIEMGSWQGSFGRVSPKFLTEAFPEGLGNKLFCICGSTPFVVDIVNLLKTLGVSQEHIRTEKFGLIE